MAKDYFEERCYKSAWHLAIAMVGLFELKNSRTKLSKILSIGLIAFHLDGAISDIADTKPLSRCLLEKFTGK